MTLTELNSLSESELKQALTRCCGSSNWVENMVSVFPVSSQQNLFNKAEDIWDGCTEEDWKEAFSHHPKIGDAQSLKEKFASTSQWAEGEQSGVQHTSDQVLEAFKTNNQLYEERFGYIFIVCATGKSAEEMLSMLTLRLLNSQEDEINIAMEEQNKITQLRLQKLLS